MSELEDNRLVDYLYGEMDPSERQAFQEDMEADQALAKTVEEMQSMLGSLRALEVEEAPSDHVDSLILAQAKQTIESQEESWIQKLFGRPGLALAFSGAFALVIAVIVLPNMQTQAPVNDFSGVEVTQQPQQSASKKAPNTSPPPKNDTIVTRAEEEAPPQVARKARKTEQVRRKSKQETQMRSTFSGKRKRAKKSQSIAAGPLGAKMKNEPSPKGGSQDLEIAISQLGARGNNSALEIGTVGALDGALSPNRSKMRSKPQGRIKERALPGPDPRTKRTRSLALADVSTSIPEDPAQREAWARKQARNAQKIARKFLKSGDVRAARKTYLKTRTWVRGTVAFFEVSLWLAQLEYSQGRFAEARQFAAEAGRSRDQSIQEKAREVVARVREDQSQSDSVPASTE